MFTSLRFGCTCEESLVVLAGYPDYDIQGSETKSRCMQTSVIHVVVPGGRAGGQAGVDWARPRQNVQACRIDYCLSTLMIHLLGQWGGITSQLGAPQSTPTFIAFIKPPVTQDPQTHPSRPATHLSNPNLFSPKTLHIMQLFNLNR